MPAPARQIPHFITGEGSQLGIPGLLQKLVGSLGNMGTATVISGATTVVVTDANAAAGDWILCNVMTKGANACVIVGVTISAGVSFTITVNTDPGAGGCVIAFVRLPVKLLFPN